MNPDFKLEVSFWFNRCLVYHFRTQRDKPPLGDV